LWDHFELLLSHIAIHPMQPFAQTLHLNGCGLVRRSVDVLQVNLGAYCNQACIHCHVESGPTRKEMMSLETIQAVVRFLEVANIPTLDITGGAPELHPNFDFLVKSAVERGHHTIDRCNLTAIFEPGKDYLPEFFQRHRLELVCSLPCYSEENVDKQRGKGTFELSIRALKMLNELGYGHPDSDLVLNLVYNPIGPYVPPPQQELEQDYKKILNKQFGIVFNRLYCLTNVPITRYATHLKLRGEYDRYIDLLAENFNPTTLDHVMCRSLLSVGWDGLIYDCDFNQMLALPLHDPTGRKLHISTTSIAQIENSAIAVGDHCYACTAGCGSSCGGALVPSFDGHAS